MSETETSTDVSPGRRRPPLAVALVAAAVLAAGGGTYLAVDRTGGGSDAVATGATVDGRGGPALSPSPGGTAPGTASGGTGPGIAPGEPDPGGGERYRVAGPLPKAPEKGYAYRAPEKVTAADAARLAKALGLAATPVKGPVGWRVGPQKDGSGASLNVYESGDWRYEARGPVTDDCAPGKRCGTGPTGEPVSDEEARRAVAPLLKALGMADAAVYTEARDALRKVTAEPRVDGLPTRDWGTEFTVDAGGGVVLAEGRLSSPVRSEAYPVISAEQAVRELNRTVGATWPREGVGGCATPVPHGEGGTGPGTGRADVAGTGVDAAGAGGVGVQGGGADAGGVDPSGPCAPGTKTPKAPGDPEVTIRTAAFGLSPSVGRTGATLVPTWLFEGERDGRPYRFGYPAVPLERLYPKAEASHLTVAPYAPQDQRLRVSFTGGACGQYLVRVHESDSQVRLRLFEVPAGPHRVCVAIALPVTATVDLAEPIGDRAVVDAATGRPLPRGSASVK
ncbi:hypothetical protein [Streptomyces thermolilacinus]|uniref:hypothetical protein n=1 Tax=Streptomyces thermolilacinus TaxID=285540 RepID=UPI0034018319